MLLQVQDRQEGRLQARREEHPAPPRDERRAARRLRRRLHADLPALEPRAEEAHRRAGLPVRPLFWVYPLFYILR
mgnify:CR=1 FL=1